MRYEIEVVFYGDGLYNQSVISSLTGLDFEESDEAVKSVKRLYWSGQTYVQVFRKLGFNTNPRFIKFDTETPYPCIMRCINHKKGVWYLFLYHQGMVYDIHGKCFHITDPNEVSRLNGSYFLKWYGMKVTSMLQVWI